MYPTIHHQIVAAGVEEEFHIVDLATRRLTGQADRLMGRLPADRFSWEMQRSVVEANSRPWAGLAGRVVRPGESGGRYVCELLVSLPVCSA